MGINYTNAYSDVTVELYARCEYAEKNAAVAVILVAEYLQC